MSPVVSSSFSTLTLALCLHFMVVTHGWIDFQQRSVYRPKSDIGCNNFKGKYSANVCYAVQESNKNYVSYKSHEYVCELDGNMTEYKYNTLDCLGNATEVKFLTKDNYYHDFMCQEDYDCEYAIVYTYNKDTDCLNTRSIYSTKLINVCVDSKQYICHNGGFQLLSYTNTECVGNYPDIDKTYTASYYKHGRKDSDDSLDYSIYCSYNDIISECNDNGKHIYNTNTNEEEGEEEEEENNGYSVTISLGVFGIMMIVHCGAIIGMIFMI